MGVGFGINGVQSPITACEHASCPLRCSASSGADVRFHLTSARQAHPSQAKARTDDIRSPWHPVTTLKNKVAPAAARPRA